MRSFFIVINVLIIAGLLSLAFVSLLKQGYKNHVNRLFMAISVLVSLWIISNSLSNYTSLSHTIALIANYVVISSSFAVGILLMQFVVNLASIKRLSEIVRLSIFPLWIICGIGSTPLVVAGIKAQGGVYAVVFGPLLWLYTIGTIFLLGVIGFAIIHGLSHNKGLKRRQIKTVGVGLLFSLPLVMLFSFVIPTITGEFSVTEFSITPLIISVISLYYSAVKHQLFDIRLAVVRTSAYALSLLTLSVIYYYVAYLVSLIFFEGRVDSSVSISPINIALALILAFIFQPVKRFFDKITNRIFYKDNYNTDDFFARLNRSLTLTTDLRGLLERSAYEIGHTLKSEQAFFFIYTNDNHYVSAGTPKHKQLPKGDATQIDEHYKNDGHEVIIASLLEQADPLRRMMISHRIELILPLIQADETIGYLCLGDHLTSGYTNRDIKALGTVSDELVIAIQNALAVHEISELNATLQQKVANATKELRSSNAILRQLDKVKDEFISMASHQLRTPLTSVKGYISMVIEGDAGKITASQKQLLNEAFISSERMVHLINDFLNVSRIQTGKFIIDKSSVDLSKLVSEEVESLRPNATARNLKFVYRPPKKFPMMDMDEGKIRQVVMNFADNAIYYSHEGGTITVSLSVDKNDILFTVKDTGIGVPKHEREQLFSKFYRASNARVQRPDGTGVGIYLAKKVIDAHGGKVVFESVEGKGSTFGFRLPIQSKKD